LELERQYRYVGSYARQSVVEAGCFFHVFHRERDGSYIFLPVSLAALCFGELVAAGHLL